MRGRRSHTNYDRDISESLWLTEASEPVPVRKLRRRADVAVVGGGVTGCACALTLAERGLATRLFEARTIAGGASGRNGGFALRGGAMAYDEARRRLGRELARALWMLSERALDELAELASDAFRRTGSLRLAAGEGERARLQAEYAALREDGFAADWVDDLSAPLGALYAGALRHPRDGSLQPARWVRRLARRAAEAGAEIAERHRVESLDALDADAVVIATDGYTSGLAAELDAAVRPVRNQVIATEPLTDRVFECPHYARDGLDYWQQTDDGRLIVGGRRDAGVATEETAEEGLTRAVQAQLEALAEQLVGAKPRVAHRWSGIFGRTSDLLPLAGRLPGREGVWAACGYSGHGNTLGFACGRLVARAIAGEPAPELELFDPARLLHRQPREVV